MSYEEIHHKQVKARKEYKCIWCGEKILKGEAHYSRAYKFDGDFISDRMHNECEKSLNSADHDDIMDGFMAYSFDRGTIQHRDYQNL